LRVVTKPVTYLNDASVHEQMTRFATELINAGKLPFTSWFPFTGLGSAQYMRYQSLGSVLVGLAGTVFGAATSFRWSIYLLVAAWPVVVYASARLFGLRRRVAIAAALLSPFVVSATGIAYERGAYMWIGGAEVWTQLLGSWTMPFAWAASWRAMKDPRFMWVASALTGTTVALHFMSGYLAFLAVIVFAVVAPGPWRKRAWRAGTLFAGALVAAAWVIVPLMVFAKTSAINQPLADTDYVKGYGARHVLAWVFTGQLFDARRRLPVISVVVLAGFVVAVACWRKVPLARALLGLFVASLLLSFGPTTWGALANLVPAHADLYFRRFMMGAQLAGVYMAGSGAAWVWDTARRLVTTFSGSRPVQRVALACVTVSAVGWFWPAWAEIASYDHQNTVVIDAQRGIDTSEGSLLAPMVSYIKSHGGGRVYAGLPSNWGQQFRVGYVPVYKYLEGQDVDLMTYVVPTLSLMLDPEAAFDQDNPADYALFGIHYLIMPTGMSPPVPAQSVMVKGGYSLWQLPTTGYVELVQVTATMSADRSNIGSRSLAFLETLAPNEDWTVTWPGLTRPPPVPTSANAGAATPSPPGTVHEVDADLARGTLSAAVTMDQPGALLLSVAFDPGWHAWVNGRPVRTEMLAPALVGLELAPGQYDVVFRYEGFGWYPELWLLGLVGLTGAAVLGRRWQATEVAGAPGV
jgi:hypothetical protein